MPPDLNRRPAIPAPISGAMMNNHSCPSAAGLVPMPMMAGPRERAGLTETPVTLIPTIWIATNVSPIAKPANCVGLPFCVGSHAMTRCDTTSAESVAAASETIERALGPCDVLVNTAAVLRPGGLDTLSLAEWNAVLAVNLTGYFLCAQVFGRQMRALGRGSLVHIASIAGSHAQGRSGAYSVSKAGVVMLSRQLASEWGPLGIRSNVVSPGMVITPMSQSFYDTPGVTERRAAVTPARRVGMPQDIAEAVLFLASDRSSYVTGDEITVDGGYVRTLMNLVPRPGFD
jgi:NAD(P)-dependent dehydrogenase (short-subunit alcohol dehydrogenase family)